MSLDVYLTLTPERRKATGVFILVGTDEERELTWDEWTAAFPTYEPISGFEERQSVFWKNITHNLGKMADAAGLYESMWRPDEIGVTHARQLIAPLTSGIERLTSDPASFKAHTPSNGWGSYDGLVRFAQEYLEACTEYPDAMVRVSR